MNDDDKCSSDESLGLTDGVRERLGIPRGKARIENERDPETGELTARALAARLYGRR